MKILGYATATIFVLAYNMFLFAFALRKLWQWFICHQFAVEEISLSMALGFSLIVTVFKAVPESEKEKTYQEVLSGMFLTTTGKYLSLLFFGWIVSKFV